jgi:hypothetical protein
MPLIEITDLDKSLNLASPTLKGTRHACIRQVLDASGSHQRCLVVPLTA